MPILHLHPQATDFAGSGEASATREGTELLLRFELEGAVDEVILPEATPQPSRRDGLWRSTCFEAFIRPARSESYFELNLAPNGDWAFYHFTGRRAGMSSPEMRAPAFEFACDGDRLSLLASIDLAGHLSPAVPWELGLTAVISRRGGGLDYWALAHPAEGPPNFHDPACFVLDLPPPSGT